MSNSDPTGTDWTEWEVDLIVTDYFDMLHMELSGKPYVKAQRNAELQKLTGRSRGAIEYKHQNISAALLKLGEERIRGYKPMANYQSALMDGIERYLIKRRDDWTNFLPRVDVGFAETNSLFLEPPPKLDTVESREPPALRRLIRKFDPAARDARNRVLGKHGEEWIFRSEKQRLRQAGRDDLAKRVKWISEVEGDGAGFDILSYSAEGDERLLEVKTTTGVRTTPFFISENERRLSEEKPDKFRLIRLYSFLREPRGFELLPPLENSVVLTPQNYRASF